MLPGAEVIGEAAIKRLRLAGYDVVRRTAEDADAIEVVRWKCPHCGTIHAPALGQHADTFLDWGESWHRPCVPSGRVSPAKRGDRRPMVEIE